MKKIINKAQYENTSKIVFLILPQAICDDTERQIEETSPAFDINEKTRLGHRGLQFLQALASRYGQTDAIMVFYV